MVQKPLKHFRLVMVDAIVKRRRDAIHGLDRGGIRRDDSQGQIEIVRVDGIVDGRRSFLRRKVINRRTQVERARRGSEQSKTAVASATVRIPAPALGGTAEAGTVEVAPPANGPTGFAM